jgi:hypothetical protein
LAGLVAAKQVAAYQAGLVRTIAGRVDRNKHLQS